MKKRDLLRTHAALTVLVNAYQQSTNPGHSDLDREQPHRFDVRGTLGDFRDAYWALSAVEAEIVKKGWS